MVNDPRLWFGPPRFGLGVAPRTWEGWAMIGGFVALIAIVVTVT